MTEAEWENTATVRSMLAFVEGRASERQLRLFVCACCLLAWEFFRHAALRQALGAAQGRVNRGVAYGSLVACVALVLLGLVVGGE